MSDARERRKERDQDEAGAQAERCRRGDHVGLPAIRAKAYDDDREVFFRIDPIGVTFSIDPGVKDHAHDVAVELNACEKFRQAGGVAYPPSPGQPDTVTLWFPCLACHESMPQLVGP